nr:MAG TPA: hypothetical protein [Caudoviricetes sp.]
MTNLKALKQQTIDMEAKLKEMKAEIEQLENGWEMKCPYREGDRFYFVHSNGSVSSGSWYDWVLLTDSFNHGNIFPTRQEAKLEAKRRNLLTRFRAFRDECNGDWKPDWRKNDAKYYFYISSTDGEIGINDIYFYETFPLFAYFKNEEDAERAIELFGDEIKELFVEGIVNDYSLF